MAEVAVMIRQVVGAIEVSLESAMSNPRLTAPGQMPTASVMVVQVDDQFVVFMNDRNRGCSITNGAEKICAFIKERLLADVPYKDIRWVYRDTAGTVEGIVTNGVEVSFCGVVNDSLIKHAIEALAEKTGFTVSMPWPNLGNDDPIAGLSKQTCSL
jgi:hypothetical protein